MKFVWLTTLALLVAGCAVDPVLDSEGPHSWAGSDGTYTDPKVNGPGQFGAFAASYRVAYADELKISSGTPDHILDQFPPCNPKIPNQGSCCDPNSTDKGSCSLYSQHARQMAMDGVSLADALCDGFFRKLGDT